MRRNIHPEIPYKSYPFIDIDYSSFLYFRLQSESPIKSQACSLRSRRCAPCAISSKLADRLAPCWRMLCVCSGHESVALVENSWMGVTVGLCTLCSAICSEVASRWRVGRTHIPRAQHGRPTCQVGTPIVYVSTRASPAFLLNKRLADQMSIQGNLGRHSVSLFFRSKYRLRSHFNFN